MCQMKVGRPQGGPNGMSAAQMQAAATAAAAVSGYGQLAARAALSVPSTSIVTSSPTHADDSRKYTVVLDNMVPLHEASDPTLKAEIEEEAAVYGPLKYISIEVVRSEFVRVKLVYLGTASALNAYRAMDGRYFGGKLLKASLE